MAKRVLLLIGTNLAIVLVLSIALGLLGYAGLFDEQHVGIDYGTLLIIAAVIGIGGSLISLAMSKSIAKRMTRFRVIERPRDDAERWLLDTVRRQARQAISACRRWPCTRRPRSTHSPRGRGAIVRSSPSRRACSME